MIFNSDATISSTQQWNTIATTLDYIDFQRLFQYDPTGTGGLVYKRIFVSSIRLACQMQNRSTMRINYVIYKVTAKRDISNFASFITHQQELADLATGSVSTSLTHTWPFTPNSLNTTLMFYRVRSVKRGFLEPGDNFSYVNYMHPKRVFDERFYNVTQSDQYRYVTNHFVIRWWSDVGTKTQGGQPPGAAFNPNISLVGFKSEKYIFRKIDVQEVDWKFAAGQQIQDAHATYYAPAVTSITCTTAPTDQEFFPATMGPQLITP